MTLSIWHVLLSLLWVGSQESTTKARQPHWYRTSALCFHMIYGNMLKIHVQMCVYIYEQIMPYH